MMVPDFRYPLQPAPRVAVIPSPTQVTSLGQIRAADTIAAPANVLKELTLSGWEPCFPVIAFSGASFGLLTDEDRDLIWQRWGVPVFEQLISHDVVVAEECEAHDGLHLVREKCTVRDGELVVEGRRTGILVEVEDALCDCLKSAPRVKRISYAARANTAGA